MQKSDVQQNFALKGLPAKKVIWHENMQKNTLHKKSEVEWKFAVKVILYDNMQS